VLIGPGVHAAGGEQAIAADAERAQHLAGDAALGGHERQHDVLRAHVVVPEPGCVLAGLVEGVVGGGCPASGPAPEVVDAMPSTGAGALRPLRFGGAGGVQGVASPDEVAHGRDAPVADLEDVVELSRNADVSDHL
jgi:hypothetical protein